MLRIYQVNDVYSLTNLPRLKLFIDNDMKKVKACLEERGRPVSDVTFITILPGDFLSPYLLSTLDRYGTLFPVACSSSLRDRVSIHAKQTEDNRNITKHPIAAWA
jgi:hypothetical protein